MTKKEFKHAMCCGLGRCVQELESVADIEAYRDIVLWGCTHELAYDAQCEGTRGWYLYRLVKCFPDGDFFVKRVIPHLYRSSEKSGWAFSQFSDFLGMFAGEGNQAAHSALWEAYRQMYGQLLSKKRRLANGSLPLFDNFEVLCIALVNVEGTREDAEEVYVRIVQDVGNLMLENPLFHTWSFHWFQACWENEFGKTKLRKKLLKMAQGNEKMKTYLTSMQCETAEWAKSGSKRREAQANLTAQEIYAQLQDGEAVGKLFPLMQVRLMRHRGNEDEARALAGFYQKERDHSVRRRLLGLFANRDCAELLDVDAVLADAESEDDALRECAFRALEYRRDARVRAFALKLLRREECTEHVIYLLANNYEPEDHDRLIALVKALPITYEETKGHWHGAFLAVLDLLETRGVKKAPKELLPYMYKYTLCSCCREHIVREMRRRRMLTEEILQECRYDCNEEVRNFVFLIEKSVHAGL